MYAIMMAVKIFDNNGPKTINKYFIFINFLKKIIKMVIIKMVMVKMVILRNKIKISINWRNFAIFFKYLITLFFLNNQPTLILILKNVIKKLWNPEDSSIIIYLFVMIWIKNLNNLNKSHKHDEISKIVLIN